ncbi:hypothetical protein [Oceanirhabdus sp. W0125-5]|uniref:hypothetical protein n=1 Tax=Oceanirhabdus sp. W0125-5 TaxID=2999116 RepID=UPI0022F2E6FB|nr:hypothetical protein [Oceanirhabdus sp. W0125-5]WBW94682.1 hypothetical protein OW730_13350 [Oceanirhabdus sp. W0125-5]
MFHVLENLMISNIKQEMNNELSRIENEYNDRSEYSKGFARMPFMRTLSDPNRYLRYL